MTPNEIGEQIISQHNLFEVEGFTFHPNEQGDGLVPAVRRRIEHLCFLADSQSSPERARAAVSYILMLLGCRFMSRKELKRYEKAIGRTRGWRLQRIAYPYCRTEVHEQNAQRRFCGPRAANSRREPLPCLSR